MAATPNVIRIPLRRRGNGGEGAMTTEAPEGTKPTPQPSPAATIHEAEPAPGPSGAILFGPQIDFDHAVAQRRAGQDVVIRGDDTDANRRLASRIEAAVGPPTRPQAPERKAGPLALPHFHQRSRDPAGHLFYETEKRKARKRS
jgi:hypothetical protein